MLIRGYQLSWLRKSATVKSLKAKLLSKQVAKQRLIRRDVEVAIHFWMGYSAAWLTSKGNLCQTGQIGWAIAR